MLPIVHIKKMVEALLDIIRKDSQQDDQTNTFLYKIFNDSTDGTFNFYEQAKSLFLRGDESPRNVKVGYELPKDKTGLPCYVVREPHKIKGPGNAIGKIVAFSPDGQNIEYRDHRRYNMEILCVSDNYLESVTMGEALYAAFLASYDTLATMYDTIEFSQDEVMVNTDLVPFPVFMKTVSVDLSAMELVTSFSNVDLLSDVIFLDAGQTAADMEYGTE